jgi:hypothetical protein
LVVTNGVMVDPVLQLKEVDLKTGHLSFNGKSPSPAMYVAACPGHRRHQHLRRHRERHRAVHRRQRLRTVGIIGTTDATCSCTVSAKANLSCLFVEHSTLDAGGDIIINGDAVQSPLILGGPSSLAAMRSAARSWEAKPAPRLSARSPELSPVYKWASSRWSWSG